MNGIIQRVLLCIWRLSHITFVRFTHLALFLVLTGYFPTVLVYHSVFVHPLANTGRLLYLYPRVCVRDFSRLCPRRQYWIFS
jgi:hypothetical protein